MSNKFLFILLAILIFFSFNIHAQDYSKLIELQEKFKKLAIQLSNSKTDSEAKQIQAQLDALTQEMMLEGQRIEHEAMGTPGEEPKGLLSQEEFTQKTLRDLDAKIKSLPPALQEIYWLERKLDDLIPEKNAEEINDISNQIIDKMGKIYSGEIKVETDATSFVSAIKFVKKGSLTCEVEGTAVESDYYDLDYKMVVNMNVVWVAHYMVDILQKKGYLITYTIDTYTEIEPEKVQFPKLSGTKSILKMGLFGAKGPIDKYKFDPGYGLFQIAPQSNKVINWEDIQSWPDEMVKEYRLDFIRPQIYLYSSMDDVELKPFIPFPISYKLSEVITPSDLNEGIQNGKYSKTLTFSDPPGPALATTLKIHILFEPLICDERGNPGAMAVSGACIDHGGYIFATDDLVYIDGKPVARVGDEALCFRHGVTEIVGDANIEVYSDKQRIARVGDKTTCGAVIIGGSRNIYAGDKKK